MRVAFYAPVMRGVPFMEGACYAGCLLCGLAFKWGACYVRCLFCGVPVMRGAPCRVISDPTNNE